MNYSIAEGIQKLSMPLVTAQVNDINLTFLIDTGSTHNIIANFVFEQLKDAFRTTGQSNKIMGVEGQYQDVITVNAKIKIEDFEFNSTFNVVDMNDAVIKLQNETGLQLHGILGIPFLMDNKCILDFCNQKLMIHEVI